VSQSSEFFRRNPFCCFSTSVYYYLFCYWLSPDTFGYTVVSSGDPFWYYPCIFSAFL